MDQKVAILVDVQNMYYSARSIFNGKLDYAKLLDLVVRGRRLIRAICYIVVTDVNEQLHFVATLKKMNYEVKAKELRVRADGSRKADWDMGMAIDAVGLSDKVDVIILVSGDGDFSALPHHLKAKGVKTEAVAFPASASEELVQAADEFIELGEEMILRED